MRYLAAKRSVDDRALNRRVWETLAAQLAQWQNGRPLRVLEIGAGIGTMAERAVEWGLLRAAEYTAIDADTANIDAARQRLRSTGLDLRLRAIDLFDFMKGERDGQWDLLIAHAFLDLIDIPATLPDLLALLAPGGLFYFTLVFDGVTSFLPAIDPDLDALIERLYHETMDRRMVAGRPSGDSQSGRHLIQHLLASDVELLAAGSSDWLVYPDYGTYQADESYFLHFIIDTVHKALAGNSGLAGADFTAWVETRHRQIDRGELIYLAHQIDCVGRTASRPA